jgi:hypothetical protein
MDEVMHPTSGSLNQLSGMALKIQPFSSLKTLAYGVPGGCCGKHILSLRTSNWGSFFLCRNLLLVPGLHAIGVAVVTTKNDKTRLEVNKCVCSIAGKTSSIVVAEGVQKVRTTNIRDFWPPCMI